MRRLRAVGVYLESIRSPFNLGSIIRTAAAFGVVRVGVSATVRRWTIARRAQRDGRDAVRSSSSASRDAGSQRD